MVRSMRAAFAVTVLGACAVPASASVFYGVTSGGALLEFDMSAQSVSTVATLTIGGMTPPSFEDLEFDADGGLVALNGFGGTGFPPTGVSNNLFNVNPDTGSMTLASSLATSGVPYFALGLRGSNQEMYTVLNSNGALGTIDVDSGAFSPVTGTAHGIRNRVEALATNPVTGLSYAIVNGGGSPPFGSPNYTLLAMDMDAGTSTVIGSLGVGTDAFRSLRFDADGVAYTVNSNTGDVYTVDVGTGAATFLFAGGATAAGTSGLALVVPTPGAAGLAMVAGVFASRRRRR